MRLRARAALAAIGCALFTTTGCGKSGSEVEIPSLNDPVTVNHQQEVSTDTFDSTDPIGGLPNIPGSGETQPLVIPDAGAADSPSAAPSP